MGIAIVIGLLLPVSVEGVKKLEKVINNPAPIEYVQEAPKRLRMDKVYQGYSRPSKKTLRGR